MIAELVSAFKHALLCNYMCARLSGEKQAEREREREPRAWAEIREETLSKPHPCYLIV